MLLKQPPLSIGQVIGVVFMFFYIIEPKIADDCTRLVFFLIL